MRAQKNRVIIDTNLWISFLLKKDYSKLDDIISANSITLIFSNELIEEFLSVTNRLKFRKYFAKDDVEALLLKIYNRGVFVLAKSEVHECRDPKDDFYYPLQSMEMPHILLQVVKIYLPSKNTAGQKF